MDTIITKSTVYKNHKSYVSINKIDKGLELTVGLTNEYYNPTRTIKLSKRQIEKLIQTLIDSVKSE